MRAHTVSEKTKIITPKLRLMITKENCHHNIIRWNKNGRSPGWRLTEQDPHRAWSGKTKKNTNKKKTGTGSTLKELTEKETLA